MPDIPNYSLAENLLPGVTYTLDLTSTNPLSYGFIVRDAEGDYTEAYYVGGQCAYGGGCAPIESFVAQLTPGPALPASEPASLALMASGMAGIVGMRRRV